MNLHVFFGSGREPAVIETNLGWAIPYWTKRKQQAERQGLRIRFVEVPRADSQP